MPDPSRSKGQEILATVALAASGVVLGGVLWFVTLPLLPKATAGSLALTTAWVGFETLQQVWLDRKSWREAALGGAILFVILWPLLWLTVSYGTR